jgi:uncharacterized membrane protein YjgN (DUF898 family)
MIQSPKEKAIEIVNEFLQVYDGRVSVANKCAIILVNRMIDEYYWHNTRYGTRRYAYYLEVKQEIESL